MNGQISKVAHDYGTEFKKYFALACEQLGIEQYYSRPRTPKYNPECERFNQTLEKVLLLYSSWQISWHIILILYNKTAAKITKIYGNLPDFISKSIF